MLWVLNSDAKINTRSVYTWVHNDTNHLIPLHTLSSGYPFSSIQSVLFLWPQKYMTQYKTWSSKITWMLLCQLVLAIKIKANISYFESCLLSVQMETIFRTQNSLKEENLALFLWFQSDLEKREGLPVSPFMDRDKVNKNSSQVNFIRFVLLPLFDSLADLYPTIQVCVCRSVNLDNVILLWVCIYDQ